MLNAPLLCLEDNLSEDIARSCSKIIAGPANGYFLPTAIIALLLSYFGKLPGTGRHKKIKKT